MKRFSVSALVLSLMLFVPLAFGQQKLREHMRSAGVLWQEISGELKDPGRDIYTLGKLRQLRGLLVVAMTEEPPKFQQLKDAELNSARLDYYQNMSAVVEQIASLEAAVDERENAGRRDSSRNEPIQQLVREIQLAIEQAHQKFRD